jgi:hypothetical protein
MNHLWIALQLFFLAHTATQHNAVLLDDVFARG